MTAGFMYVLVNASSSSLSTALSAQNASDLCVALQYNTVYEQETTISVFERIQ